MVENTPGSVGPDFGSANITTPLILDFLQWLAPGPRPYTEVMEAWRTSCPRLTVWEDAIDRGYVVRTRVDKRPAVIAVTPRGRQRLTEAGRSPERSA